MNEDQQRVYEQAQVMLAYARGEKIEFVNASAGVMTLPPTGIGIVLISA